MAEAINYEAFSENEIQNLQEGLIQLELELLVQPDLWYDFINDPISFLSRFNISLLNRFKSKPHFAGHFNETVRSILGKFERIFNRCLACKLGVIILVYSLIGHVGEIIEITIDSIRALRYAFEKLFGGTSEAFESLSKKLESRLKQLTIPGLALTVCQYYKQCPVLTI